MLWKMAWRNLWRNKRRSVITCFSVAFGFFLSLSLTGMAEDSYRRTVDTGAKMGLGHVTVQPSGYLEKPGLDRWITGAGATRALAQAQPEVKGAVVRIMGQAMFGNGGRTRGGQFIAIDPAHETADSNLFIKSIVEGEPLGSADERGGLIGVKMAERLQVGLGKKVVFMTTDAKGEVVSDVVRVKGIFKTGVAEVDGGVVVLPLGKVREALGYGPDDASLVAVVLHDQRHSAAVQARLQAAGVSPGAEVLTWRETQADLVGFLAVDRATNRLFQLLVGLLIAAGVLNTIYMSVLERRREFGVMLAVGMGPGRLFWLVIIESMFIGAIGVVVGGLGTIPWYRYMVNTGIDMSSMMAEGMDIGGIVIDPVMRMSVPPQLLVAITAILFGLTIAAGLFPAWIAGRTPPVESIRLV